MRRSFAALVLLFCGLLVPAGLQAGQAPGGPGGRPGRRQFSPEEMRRRMEEFRRRMSERLRERLGASEDEWKVIAPLIEKVRQAQGELRFGGGAFRFMRGRPGRGPQGRPPREPQTEVGKAVQNLRQILDKEDAKPKEIKAALERLRQARKKAEAQLKEARENLRKVLTLRQEAILVMLGILD